MESGTRRLWEEKAFMSKSTAPVDFTKLFFPTERRLDHSDYKKIFFQRGVRMQNSQINLCPNVFILDPKLYFSAINTFA